jgi:hypothetical protein
MNNNIIIKTAYASLYVQLITGIIGFYGLFLNIPLEYNILKEILYLETIVQIIELVYYLWLTNEYTKINYDISYTRYFDWFISTPIMLLNTAIYMYFEEFKDTKNMFSMIPIILEKINPLSAILFGNFAMLVFGFLGEQKQLKRMDAFIWGTFSFIVTFATLYINFVGSVFTNQILFWAMFVIWSIYGISYLFPYEKKNAFYNILDIFSKNFYGIYIFLKVLQVSN